MVEEHTTQGDASHPTAVGVIMDGNRRWAQGRGKPVTEGHRAGYGKLKEVVEWCKEGGVYDLVVYAFSTENWRRAEEEVGGLMQLMRHVLEHELAELRSHDVAVRVVGNLARFPEDLQQSIARLHETNSPDAQYRLWVCASYGGRAEIVDAAAKLVRVGGEVTEARFTEALWSHGMPDPDLVVRTGGQQRLSNFLPWQSVYSELFFLDTLWPDFSRDEWNAVLAEYGERKRNFGA